MPNGVEELLVDALRKIDFMAASSEALRAPADTFEAIGRVVQGALDARAAALGDSAAELLRELAVVEAAHAQAVAKAKIYARIAAGIESEIGGAAPPLPGLAQTAEGYRIAASRSVDEQQRLLDVGTELQVRLIDLKKEVDRIAEARGVPEETRTAMRGALESRQFSVSQLSIANGTLQAEELLAFRFISGERAETIAMFFENNMAAINGNRAEFARMVRDLVRGPIDQVRAGAVGEFQASKDASEAARGQSSGILEGFFGETVRVGVEGAFLRSVGIPLREFASNLTMPSLQRSPNTLPGLESFTTRLATELRLLPRFKGGRQQRARRATRP